MLSTGQLLLPSHSWVEDMLCVIVMMSAEHVTILYFVCTVYSVLYVAEQRTVRLVSKHQPGAELAGQHWGMDHFSCCHPNFML